MKPEHFSFLYSADNDNQSDFFDNRSFRYGDGFFETMSVFQGKLVLHDAHFERIKKSAEVLKMGLDAAFYQSLENAISSLPFANARVRITVFRGGAGFYRPEQSNAGFHLSATSRNENLFVLNPKGLSILSYKEHLKPITTLGALKTNNALLYVLASNYAKENSKDDALIFNDKKRICETSRGNLFVVTEKKLITPPLSEGGIHGVMRNKIMELAEIIGLSVLESKLNEDDLKEADEIWQSNAVHGIQWYVAWEKNRYFSKYALKMVSSLNEILVNSM